MPNVKAIPEGYSNVTPYLIVSNAAAAIDFYTRIFGAVVTMNMPRPDGRVAHAELRIGNSMIMLADENPAVGARSPQAIGGTPVSFLIYVEKVDDVTRQAEAAGAKVVHPPKDQFYGDRMSTVADPFGHLWTIATHVEDVTPDEMRKRMAAAAG